MHSGWWDQNTVRQLCLPVYTKHCPTPTLFCSCACSYGLEEGALVLVSALGKPATSVLQHAADLGDGLGGGVVAQMQAQHEIAADLAAATAAAGGTAAAAGDVKPDVKPEVKPDALVEQAADAGAGGPAAAAEEAGLEPLEKRQRVV